MREFLAINCTLGELIRIAREDKGLTRTKLAEFAGITPNSMVRYEMAGTPEGKYPSVLKLVKICEILELDPRHAFDAIKYESYQADHQENPIPEGELPDSKRFGLRFSHHFRTGDDWLNWKLSVKNIEDLNEALNTDIAGNLHYLDKRLERMEQVLNRHFVDAMKNENGPGKDPSRSNGSDNAEVVGAASTSHKPKGGG